MVSVIMSAAAGLMFLTVNVAEAVRAYCYRPEVVVAGQPRS